MYGGQAGRGSGVRLSAGARRGPGGWYASGGFLSTEGKEPKLAGGCGPRSPEGASRRCGYGGIQPRELYRPSGLLVLGKCLLPGSVARVSQSSFAGRWCIIAARKYVAVDDGLWSLRAFVCNNKAYQPSQLHRSRAAMMHHLGEQLVRDTRISSYMETAPKVRTKEPRAAKALGFAIPHSAYRRRQPHGDRGPQPPASFGDFSSVKSHSPKA